MSTQNFTVKNLIAYLSFDRKQILKGLDIVVEKGDVHAIMGPNGAGKTTFVLSVMGHPGYKIDEKKSKIKIGSKELQNLLPEERAKEGLFVSFQQPIEITGVSVLSFLRTAYKSMYPKEKISLTEFKKIVLKALNDAGLPEEFMGRSLNEGFSGGEKKRMEIAQLLVLKPKFVILDEIDSGLDIDSLKQISKAINILSKKSGIIIITHYQRILHYLKPDRVHVLVDGKIKQTGGMEIVEKIERDGYAAV